MTEHTTSALKASIYYGTGYAHREYKATHGSFLVNNDHKNQQLVYKYTTFSKAI